MCLDVLQIKRLELKPLFKYVLRKQFASRQVKCLFLIAYSQVYIDANRITGNHRVSLSHLGKDCTKKFVLFGHI